MSRTPRGPMSHLAGRRARRLPLQPAVPHWWPLEPVPELAVDWPPDHVQDCYCDCAEPAHIVVQEAGPGPHIVSRIVTGYSGRSPGPANDVLLVSG
jgi:hypothetical protein